MTHLRTRLSICVLAAALIFTPFTEPQQARADGAPSPSPASSPVANPASTPRFPGIDDELDRILAQQVVAAPELDGSAITTTPVKLNSTAAKVVVSTCPKNAKFCVEAVPDDNSVVAASGGWPSTCSANQYQTTKGWLAVTRKAACDHEKNTLRVYDVETKKQVGTATFHMGLTAEALAGGAGWTMTGYLAMWAYTGEGRPQMVTARVSPSPTGASGGVTGWNAISTNDVWQGSAWISAPTMKSKQVVKGVGGAWAITASNPKWANTATWVLPRFKSRCDRYYATPGCVIPQMPGVATFSKATAPQYAKHVTGALKSGLPGKFGSSSYLTRLTDKTLIRRNRSKACPSSLTRPKGYSCDEYPFASTKQGAYTASAPKARSQPWCQMKDPERTGRKGWSRCFIKATDNSVGGGYLSGFYRLERMLAGDKFQVGFIA